MLSPSQTVMQGLVKVPLRRDILICVNTSAGVDQGAVASTGRGPSPSCVWVVCVDVRLQLLDGITVWTELCWKEIQCIFPAFSQNYAKLRRHKSTFVSVQSMSYFLLFPVRPRDREEAGFSTCSPRCGVYVLEWQAWHASQAFHCNVCAPRPTRRRRRSCKQQYIGNVFVTLLQLCCHILFLYCDTLLLVPKEGAAHSVPVMKLAVSCCLRRQACAQSYTSRHTGTRVERPSFAEGPLCQKALNRNLIGRRGRGLKGRRALSAVARLAAGGCVEQHPVEAVPPVALTAAAVSTCRRGPAEVVGASHACHRPRLFLEGARGAWPACLPVFAVKPGLARAGRQVSTTSRGKRAIGAQRAHGGALVRKCACGACCTCRRAPKAWRLRRSEAVQQIALRGHESGTLPNHRSGVRKFSRGACCARCPRQGILPGLARLAHCHVRRARCSCRLASRTKCALGGVCAAGV